MLMDQMQLKRMSIDISYICVKYSILLFIRHHSSLHTSRPLNDNADKIDTNDDPITDCISTKSSFESSDGSNSPPDVSTVPDDANSTIVTNNATDENGSA